MENLSFYIEIFELDEQSPDYPEILSILSCISENYSNVQMSLDFVAEKVGKCPSQLNIYCKRYFGLTTNKLICIIRMYECIEFISEPEKTCYEVGLKCGYLDPKTFRENFKRVFKKLPNEVIQISDKKSLKKSLLKKLLDYIKEVKIQI